MYVYPGKEKLLMRVDGRDTEAWVTPAGVITIRLACQTHSIDEWRKHGAQIISTHLFSQRFPITSDSIMNLVFGDQREAFERITKHIEKAKVENKHLMGLIEEKHRLLNCFLDFIEAIMAPTIAELKRKTRKGKKAAAA